jgi:hypothetical protein
MRDKIVFVDSGMGTELLYSATILQLRLFHLYQ